MADPNWNNGFYYDALPPHTGMKLARRQCSSSSRSSRPHSLSEIATITYRSGPEWDVRFGRKLRDDQARLPSLCPDFLIETYLDHQVRLSS